VVGLHQLCWHNFWHIQARRESIKHNARIIAM